jgi:hypothetical protein
MGKEKLRLLLGGFSPPSASTPNLKKQERCNQMLHKTAFIFSLRKTVLNHIHLLKLKLVSFSKQYPQNHPVQLHKPSASAIQLRTLAGTWSESWAR